METAKAIKPASMRMVQMIIWLDEDGRKLGDLWRSTNEIIDMAKSHGYAYDEQSRIFSLIPPHQQ